MSKKNKRKDEELTLTPEAEALVEERLAEVAEGKTITTEELRERLYHTREEQKLLPSHWAHEYGVDPHLFLWWDTHEGVVSRKRFEELKQQQGA